MIDEKQLAIKGLAMRAGLMPCGSLPKSRSDAALENFLRRVALCVSGASHCGHGECKFRVGGINGTPLAVMEAAIEPLKTFGYEARIVVESTVGSHSIDDPDYADTFLVVSGW